MAFPLLFPLLSFLSCPVLGYGSRNRRSTLTSHPPPRNRQLSTPKSDHARAHLSTAGPGLEHTYQGGTARPIDKPE
ncbi:hypothetical protein F4825DRAFT_405777 [Nemania diffusa]|nr:hypothetical protein F4825DRAFT_405777 [Nemania diffusa]